MWQSKVTIQFWVCFSSVSTLVVLLGYTGLEIYTIPVHLQELQIFIRPLHLDI